MRVNLKHTIITHHVILKALIVVLVMDISRNGSWPGENKLEHK